MQESIFYPLIGSFLVCLASAFMLGVLGHISGISGIINNSLQKVSIGNQWRYAYIVGLVFGGFVIKKIRPDLFDYSFEQDTLTLIISGLLIGVGVSMAKGCTSDHGVLGVSRGSKGSIIATLVYIATGVVTVMIIKKVSL